MVNATSQKGKDPLDVEDERTSELHQEIEGLKKGDKKRKPLLRDVDVLATRTICEVNSTLSSNQYG